MKVIATIISIIALWSLTIAAQQRSSVSIFLIGDSTMADKPGSPSENPERGWGQLLPEYFSDRATVRNHAVNGRSSKSFIGEGRWQSVMDSLSSGDYVFIQFGHNDQKYKDPDRYTNPWSTYRANLEYYVAATRSKGAHPILLSSIVRRKFNEYGTLVDTHGAYPAVARMVARELNVPFVDMQLLTEQIVADLGPDDSKVIYLHIPAGVYPALQEGKEDDTHLSLYGARRYAGIVVDEIRRQELPLVEYLRE